MSAHLPVGHRAIVVGLVACASLYVAGCAVTPSQTYVRAADLRGITSVAVVATAAAVSVRYAQGQATGNPLPELLGLAGHLLVEGARAAEDSADAAPLQHKVDPGAVEAILLQAFTQELGKDARFTIINPPAGTPSSEPARQADAIVRLRIATIGLHRIAAEALRLEVVVHAELATRDGRTLWERDDQAQSRHAYPLAHYQQEGVPELGALLRQLGTRLAAELVYAR